MSLAGLLIVAGLILWLLLGYSVIGIVVLIIGVLLFFWTGPTLRGGYAGRRRWWY